MIFLVTPTTVSNPAALRGGSVPRKILTGLSGVFPKGLLLSPIWWRLALEYQLLRYGFALSPFLIAILVWPDLALPISGAPLLMLLFIHYIEVSVLAIGNPDRRKRLLPADEAARRLDLYTHRVRGILTRIAAARGLTDGELTLVVEQSAMAPVPPLTVVSLQRAAEDDRRGSPVLELDGDERRLILTELFDAFPGPGKLTERDFHRMNLRDNIFLRSVAIEARSISAHARMAALARGAARAQPATVPAAAG